jgi:hypothetical protein
MTWMSQHVCMFTWCKSYNYVKVYYLSKISEIGKGHQREAMEVWIICGL